MADNNKPTLASPNSDKPVDNQDQLKDQKQKPKINLSFIKPEESKPIFNSEDFSLPSHKPPEPGKKPVEIFSVEKEKQELSQAIVGLQGQQKQQTPPQAKTPITGQKLSEKPSQPIRLHVKPEATEVEPKPEIAPEVGLPTQETKELVGQKLVEKSKDEPIAPYQPPEAGDNQQGASGSEPIISVKKKFPIIPIFAVLIVIIVAIFGFFIFKNKDSDDSDVITLDYWGLWEVSPIMQGVIAEWEQEHPNVKINYIEKDKEDYRARLQSAFSRGDGPDIFRFHNTWVSMLKNELATVPIDIANSLALKSDYFPVVSDSLDKGGQFYGLPLMIDTLGLYYNKDILLSANKSPPLTWWGLENIAKELTVRVGDRITVAGVAMGSTVNVDHWSDILGLMIYQNGGDLHKPDDFVTDAAKFFLRFKNVDRVWDDSLPRSTMAFANGKLAFYFGPSWRTFNILEANPNLNFGVAPMPQLPKLQGSDWQAAEKGEEDLTNIGWASFWVEGVAVDSQMQEEAWEFLEFLSSKETMQKLYTAQSQTRLFGEIYPVKSLAKSLETDSILKEFVAQASVAKTGFLCSQTHDDGINERVIGYYKDFLNGLAGNTPEQDLMATLSSGLNQVLSQYQVSLD